MIQPYNEFYAAIKMTCVRKILIKKKIHEISRKSGT